MQPMNPYQQPYPPQPHQPHPAYYPQQQPYPNHPQYGYGQLAAQGPKRNVALLVTGSISLAIGLLAFVGFAYNAYHYSTVEERFADIGSPWLIDIIKEADMHRMMVFGPLALVFGLAGLLLGGFGLRKK